MRKSNLGHAEDKHITRCPEVTEQDQETDYGINITISKYDDNATFAAFNCTNIWSLANPSKMAACADGGKADSTGLREEKPAPTFGRYSGYSSSHSAYTTECPYGISLVRHGKTANMLFADWHVEAITKSSLPTAYNNTSQTWPVALIKQQQ